MRPPKQIVGDVKAAFSIAISEKTVRRVLDAERRKVSESERELWDPMADETHGIDPALVLPAVAILIRISEGRRRQFTRGEARWIYRVRRAAPDLPVELAYVVASMYVRTEPANVLDAYLAFGPWRGDKEHAAYVEAMNDGWVPRWGPGTSLLIGDWEARK